MSEYQWQEVVSTLAARCGCAIVVAILIAAVGACRNDDPIRPKNNQPRIISVSVFPEIIGPRDSAIVICNAMDPDADTLVYDWITDGKLHIQGTSTYEMWLYNTADNACVFYPNAWHHPIDTVWVECSARDRRGKSDSRLVTFVIRQ